LEWAAQNPGSVMKNTDDAGVVSYLSMSYENSPGVWVHECSLPRTNASETKNYTPFTRYKCIWNKILGQDGECSEAIEYECAKKERGAAKPFTGFHYKYEPQCLIQGPQGLEIANTDACCRSCSDQYTEYSSSGGSTQSELLSEQDRLKIFNASHTDEYNFTDGVGYNTRPKISSPAGSGWGGALTTTNIDQMKNDLFVCQKTNFAPAVSTVGDRKLPGDKNIGRYTVDAAKGADGTVTPQTSPFIDSPLCDNPNSEDCQSYYTYFDPTSRTMADEDYLWMKAGTDYAWENIPVKDSASVEDGMVMNTCGITTHGDSHQRLGAATTSAGRIAAAALPRTTAAFAGRAAPAWTEIGNHCTREPTAPWKTTQPP